MADQIIPITRPSVTQPAPAPQKMESKFPTEVINLPSKGWFYPADNPLSTGTLELKMMTAKEEDILTSPNLIQKNIVLDKLLESVVVNKAINLDDMLVCDRNAAFFAIRRLAYGDQYEATLTCGRCGRENSITIDLGKMDNRQFDFEKCPKGENAFQFKLPYSGKVVTYKLLTKKDENLIDQELKGMEKVSKDLRKEITTRLGHIITALDGNTDRATIRRFVNEELVSKDSLALRTHLRETMPDIDTTFDFVCSNCNLERKEETPMGVNFFWPSTGV
jgi:transcription elongation factor Elf1